MDLDELVGKLDNIQEAGRVISTANRSLLDEISTAAKTIMEHMPGAKKISDLADELIAISEKYAQAQASAEEVKEALSNLQEAEEEELQERQFSTDQRKSLADKGHALPDGSYPITTKGDLSNAVQAIGRASDPAAAKRHIIKRAKALGATDQLPADWLKEAKTNAADSFEEQQSEIHAAVRAKYAGRDAMGNQKWVSIQATYPDYVVIRSEETGELVGIPFTKDDAGDITLGEPYDVKMQYLKEARLFEAVSGSEGREWDVILIESGLSGNNTYYDSKTLKEAAKKFEGVSAFADHATDAELRQRPERSIRDKVGMFKDVKFGKHEVDGKIVEGLKARFKIMVPWLREVLLEADRAGEPGFLGFSIDAVGKTIPKVMGGKKVRWVESISEVRSVDVVTTPAAGGRTVRLVASQAPTTERRIEDVDPEELQKMIREQMTSVLPDVVGTVVKEAMGTVVATIQEAQKPAQDALAEQLTKLQEAETKRARETLVDTKLGSVRISDLGKRRLRESLIDTLSRREVTDDELAAAIKESVDYEAAVAGNGQRALGIREAVKIVASEADKYDAAIQGLFANEDQKLGEDTIPRFHGLKEAYCRWTGADPWDNETSGPLAINRAISVRYDSAVDHRRLRESLATSSWGEIYADNLYIRMMKQYRANAVYNRWRKFVSDFEDVPDFQTRHWARIGGYGDLQAVAEGGTYPMLTTPTDEEVTYAISKRGGLDDVTFEAIVNDRFQAIRRIPDAMARAAARTLYKFVMNLMTTDNPTMDYDSVALYHATHGNTGTTALSVDGLDTTQQAMRNQTAYNESLELLGVRNAIKYLIVPNTLQSRAERIVNPSDAYVINASNSADASVDPHAFKGRGIEVEVYDQLTDATDWWAISDPNEVPTIVMGFLNGQQEPEMFVADDPKVGSNLTADKTVYKVRQIFGGDLQDHRSFYRQVVAG